MGQVLRAAIGFRLSAKHAGRRWATSHKGLGDNDAPPQGRFPCTIDTAMRSMRIHGGRSRRPAYLFGERGSPYEITLILRDRLNKELASLAPDVLLKTSPDVVINDIVQRYTLQVPALDRANISEFEPAAIKLEVPQNSQYGFFAGPGPHFIDATEFKMGVATLGRRVSGCGMNGLLPEEGLQK